MDNLIERLLVYADEIPLRERHPHVVEALKEAAASLTAIPEDVEGLCGRYDALVGKLDECGLCTDDELTAAHAVGDALRAYAAREATLRREVEAVREKFGHAALAYQMSDRARASTMYEALSILDQHVPAQGVGDAWPCTKGSCQRHRKCMYLNHPACPLGSAALIDQQEADI